MSIPIAECMFHRACSDKTVLNEIARRMVINLRHGSYTLAPCTHNPPCEVATQDELKKLEEQLQSEIDKISKK